MRTTKIILFLFLFSVNLIYAQDIHYSQFNASPQNLNPAQTGMFNGDWRFAANYRGQWAAVPAPYKTFSIAADTRLKTKLKNDVIAAGLVVNTDKTGDSKLTTTQVLLSASYIKKLNKDSTHFIALAIQPGFTSKNFDINALTFDNQYTGDSYNSSISSGENFAQTRITYFELGGGLSYLWRKTQRTQINIGISELHINQTKQSFFGNSEIRLDTKLAINGIAEFPIAAQVDLLPTFLYQKQGKYNETLIGMFGKYYLKPTNGITTAVSFGGFYRLKDALIIAANMDYRNFNVGISYDVNTSKLIAATNHRGGFEVSLIYIFKKITPFIAKKRVCPTDM